MSGFILGFLTCPRYARLDFNREALDQDFKIWLMSFNDLLGDIEKAFFEAHPEHVGRVHPIS